MKGKEMYSECRLCPRECGVNRHTGVGRCRAGDEILLARAALHHWEEPCLSGTRGSGAVFFSGCSLGCVYCQNREISTAMASRAVSTDRLAEIFLSLQAQGAHNINLVSASHFVPSVIAALDIAKGQGLKIPIVYNSSGYEKVQTLKLLSGYIDIYLPDFKYMSPVLAQRYSGAADYPEAAMAAIDEMVRQRGAASFDDEGNMTSGVIVRHLLLPECAYDSKQVLRYLQDRYGEKIYVSVMRQYTPTPYASEHFPELSCKISDKEYLRILHFCDRINIMNGFSQDSESADESFIPPFDFTGVDGENE